MAEYSCLSLVITVKIIIFETGILAYSVNELAK